MIICLAWFSTLLACLKLGFLNGSISEICFSSSPIIIWQQGTAAGAILKKVDAWCFWWILPQVLSDWREWWTEQWGEPPPPPSETLQRERERYRSQAFQSCQDRTEYNGDIYHAHTHAHTLQLQSKDRMSWSIKLFQATTLSD